MRYNLACMAMTGAERTRRYRERRYAEIAAMPKVPCACGCRTLVAPISKQLKPARYAHGHNPDGEATRFPPGHDGSAGVEARKRLGMDSGPGHPNWRGGEWQVGGGYWRVTLTPEEAALFPTARRYGGAWNIQRSHAIWNRAHPNDPVLLGEHIHHLNHDRADDRIENFEKLTAAEHRRRHGRDARGRFV